MASLKRRITNTIAQAEECKTKMPWERGLRRQAFIARRLENESRNVKVTLPPMPAGISLAASA